MQEKQEKEIRTKILLAIRQGIDISIENLKIPGYKTKAEYIIADEVFNSLYK